MIPYSRAPSSLKNPLVSFLKQFLDMMGATDHFRIEVQDNGDLTIRDRTGANAPSLEQKAKLKALMEYLQSKNLLYFQVDNNIPAHNGSGQVVAHTSGVKIAAVDLRLEPVLLNAPSVNTLITRFAITAPSSHAASPHAAAPVPQRVANASHPPIPTTAAEAEAQGWIKMNPLNAYRDFSGMQQIGSDAFLPPSSSSSAAPAPIQVPQNYPAIQQQHPALMAHNWGKPGSQFLAAPAVSNPPPVQKISLAHIPQDIRNKLNPAIASRWDRFSAALQHHIIQCIQVDLQAKFNAMLVSQSGLGQTFVSPVSLENPSIPVLLPSSQKGENKTYYDLMDVLNIQQRAPGSPELRLDPTTRESFKLDQVLPAPEALQKLQQRAEQPPRGPR